MKSHSFPIVACIFAAVAAPFTGQAQRAPSEPDPRTAPLAQEKPLYLDTSASIDERVADLIARMTLEEKAQALNHGGPNIERIGLRSDKWNQCLNGVQWNQPTTLFPICTGLAATWNTDLVHRVASVLSDEARAIYNGWRRDPSVMSQHKGLIYRDPVINIGRNPYWGRNYEIWGEDPFLTGRMGVAYTKGLQGDHPVHLKVAATLKHYAVNNVEVDRMKLNAEVSKRMLHEYWLPHFRAGVVEGKASSLMASYNAINDTPNNINHWLLTELLKEQWGHEGFVVSDLGGVNTMVQGHANQQMAYIDAVAQSVMAGCDFSDREYQEYIPQAVRAGKLSEERLHDALARVLHVRFRLGAFDPLEASPYGDISTDVINSAEHHVLSLEAARESIVLLQNDEGILPLDPASIKKLAVIGPFADAVITNGYNGRHVEVVTALQGIREVLGENVEITYAQGARGRTDPGFDRDWQGGQSGNSSVEVFSESPGEYIEFPIEAPADGTYDLTLQFKGLPTHGILQASINEAKLGDPVDMYRAESQINLTADLGRVDLTQGTHPIRFTVTGRNEASAGFTGTFDALTLAGPEVRKFEIETVDYQTRIGTGNDFLAAGIAAAQGADTVILCLGSDTRNEMEGRDRTFLGLPGNQLELAQAIIETHPRTIVVLFGAGPLTTPWLKRHTPTMLQAWWPGQKGGTAVADVLFGRVNPSGHLPYTVYASEQQVPSVDEYDISQGFTYMYLKGEPLYAFGHGLSYTTFAYDNVRVSPAVPAKDGTIEVQADVTNTGDRAGDDVVQLYTRAMNPSGVRPKHELRGFQRVSLEPGQTKTVTLSVPVDQLAYYSEEAHNFVVEPGAYEIQIGASSADIRLAATVEVAAKR